MSSILSKRVSILVVVCVAAACGSDRGTDPPANLEERRARIAEVKKQIEIIVSGDYQTALTGLTHPDHRVREQSVKRLIQLKTTGPQTVDALIKALKDEHRQVRIMAATALGRIRDQRAIEPLLYALADADPAVRLWVGKAIKKFGDQGVLRLISAMSFSSPYVDVAFEDLDGKKVPVRRIAKELLATMGTQAVPLLIAALENERDEGILHNVPGVLGKMGRDAKDALPALIKALDTRDVQMRVNVISDIGKIGDYHPEVMPTLRRAAADRDNKVSKAAKRALRTIEKDVGKKGRKE